jgi:aldehyde dehydrogenase (NAD+)
MVLDYFAKLTRSFEFEEVRPGMMGPALVRHEPVGVSAGIVPWNVPLFISMLKLAPALASGSTMVLKPAPETPLSAYALAELCADAGVPDGVVNIVPAGRETGQHLVTHPDVDKVSFTGSTAAGRKIGAACGELLRRVTLELGGKSAAIVCDDADLDAIMPELIASSTMNNGQACVAQTRILATRSRYDEVVEALTEAVAAIPVGDPADMETGCGPLIAERQRDRVEGYLQIGRDEGARITTGGGRPDGQDRGWFVEPTVFADVDNSMRIAQEEIFGPVLAVIPVDDTDDAIRVANDSDYGLSGTVWTGDVEAGLDIARKVRTGTYTVNGFAMEWGGALRRLQGLGRRSRTGSRGPGRLPGVQDDQPARRHGADAPLLRTVRPSPARRRCGRRSPRSPCPSGPRGVRVPCRGSRAARRRGSARRCADPRWAAPGCRVGRGSPAWAP